MLLSSDFQNSSKHLVDIYSETAVQNIGSCLCFDML